MSTALIRRKEQKGLDFEQKAIAKINRATVFVHRGATGVKGIVKIDKDAMKHYIESEGYGE